VYTLLQTKDWTPSNSSSQGAQLTLGGKPPEIEFGSEADKPHRAAAVDEPLATSSGLFRCRYCRYTNAHKWKMASHMKASHAGRLIYRCPQCPRFATERRVEWCAHRSRHTGKTVRNIPAVQQLYSSRSDTENKKLSYRRGTARCVVSVEILPTATQQCRNYLYDKS